MTWQERDPERYRRAHELLMMEQSRDRVVLQLTRAGLPPADAERLVEEAWETGRGERREEGRTELRQGVAWLVGGLAATIFLPSIPLGPVSFRFIAAGAMVYGLYNVISGVRKLRS